MGRRQPVKLLLKAAISLDGFLDDSLPQRRIFSSAEDFAAVQALRAEVDAVLVGAETLRRDDSRLTPYTVAGAKQPLRCTISRSGALEPSLRFFDPTAGRPLVFLDSQAAVTPALTAVAEVIRLPAEGSLNAVLSSLAARGITSLLVEGGASILRQFCLLPLEKELRLAIAPIILGSLGRIRLELPLSSGDTASTSGPSVSVTSVKMLGDTTMVSARIGAYLATS